MTTILAVQYDDGFIIGADSQVTSYDRPYSHPDVKKITEQGDYVIAGAGNSRYCDIVQYGWTLPPYDGSDEYYFMVNKVVPEIKAAHDCTGVILGKDESFKFIIGLNKKLFYVEEGYSVIRSDVGIYGLGTGSDLAVGAFSAGSTVRDAIKIAIKFDINSGGKIQIVKRGV